MYLKNMINSDIFHKKKTPTYFFLGITSTPVQVWTQHAATSPKPDSRGRRVPETAECTQSWDGGIGAEPELRERSPERGSQKKGQGQSGFCNIEESYV